MHVYEFDRDLKLLAIHNIKNSVEYDVKAIRFYDGKIYLLQGKEMVVISYTNNDYKSGTYNKILYKLKDSYIDFIVNHNGIFLFLKQVSDKESDGAVLVASKSSDVDGQGGVVTNDKRLLENFNKYQSDYVVYQASFLYSGLSNFLLKYMKTKYESHILSYLDLNSTVLKSSTIIQGTLSAQPNEAPSQLVESDDYIYSISNSPTKDQPEIITTEHFTISIKQNTNIQNPKLVTTSKSFDGKIVAMITSSQTKLNEQRIIVATALSQSSHNIQNIDYKLSLQTISFTKSALDFAPLAADKITNAADTYEIIIKTANNHYSIQACFGLKCLLEDSREVKKGEQTKGETSENSYGFLYGSIGVLAFLSILALIYVAGEREQLEETREMVDAVISKDEMDDYSGNDKQKKRIQKEIQLQNQTNMSMSIGNSQLMEDSLDESMQYRGKETSQGLNLDISVDSTVN